MKKWSSTIALLLWFLSSSVLAVGDSQYADAILINSGVMNYAISEEFEPDITENSSNFGIEVIRYHKKITAAYIGYRFAHDEESGRINYLAGHGGLRYYYWSVGSPIQTKTLDTFITINPFLKPYVSAGLSAGKILIKSSGVANIQEVSGEYFGFEFGTGVHLTLYKDFALDVNFNFEVAAGMGPIAFSSLNSMALFGVSYYY